MPIIPNSERSREELREMGRKGGIASGKARRKYKALKWMLSIVVDEAAKEAREKPGGSRRGK
ncbi:hypothetical protein [Cuneatibacter caecimuris]|nr:hypothetical protein [Cuneatibacter caecimuris]